MTERVNIGKILIRNPEGKFLTIRKRKTGNWGIPGGKISGNNRTKEAVEKVKDETNLEVDEIEDLLRLEVEDTELLNCYIMFAPEWSGEVELKQKFDEFSWVSYEEFLELNWQPEAGHNAVPMRFLDDYRKERHNYGDSGTKIDVSKTIIENHDGEFLVMKKSHLEKVSSGQKFKKYGDMSGRWELPGGRIGKKGSENRFEAAKREIKEEAGIEISDGVDVVREEVEEVNKVNTYILYYGPGDWEGDIQLSEEHDEYKWVKAREFAHMDWHKDAGYGIPPMVYLEEYLNE